MANDLNVVALSGRLTRESELRYTNGGMAICRFSLAVNRRTKKGDNWEDEASFFECSMFGKSAESVNQFLEKGKQVNVVGELRQNRWEKDGQMQSRVEVIVNNLQLIGGSGQGREEGNGGTASTSRQTAAQPARSSYPSSSGKRNTEYAGQSGNARYGSAGPKPGRESYNKPQEENYGQQNLGGPEHFDDDQIPF